MRCVFASILLMIVAAGCQRTVSEAGNPSDSAGPGMVQEVAAAAPRHELGRRIYNFRCYYCHGYSGDARTLAATYLTPAPRDFAALAEADISRERMIEAVSRGRPGTAMKGFGETLSAEEIAAVTDFVRLEFMRRKSRNTRYHTAENGWSDHERYAPAFAFATGAIALNTPAELLTVAQRDGKRLFMGACVSCHDRARVTEEGSAWAIRPVSSPPDFYLLAEWGKLKEDDAFDPHHVHEKPAVIANLTAQEKRGERLFQKNCAACHAADGSGRNWVGSFMEPNVPDLSATMTRNKSHSQISRIIADGMDGTSMPAWKAVLSAQEIGAIVAYMSRAFVDRSD